VYHDTDKPRWQERAEAERVLRAELALEAERAEAERAGMERAEAEQRAEAERLREAERRSLRGRLTSAIHAAAKVS
jgi:hypothetical protein